MCFKNSYYLELLVYFIHPVWPNIYQVKNIIHWLNNFLDSFTSRIPISNLIHVLSIIIYHPLWKKNHNKLLLLFASVQFHVYFLSLFVWHMFEPISWSASKYFKELIQCEICSSIYRYINDDAFLLRCRKICVFSSSLDS